LGKAGGSQLLNTTMGQMLALPGNTQTMMIGRLYTVFSILMVMGKAGGSQLLNTTMGQILARPCNTQAMMIGRLYL
jgi:hypothetical protein